MTFTLCKRNDDCWRQEYFDYLYKHVAKFRTVDQLYSLVVLVDVQVVSSRLHLHDLHKIWLADLSQKVHILTADIEE